MARLFPVSLFLATAGESLGIKGWLGVAFYILLFLAAAWGICKLAGPDGDDGPGNE